MSADPDFFENEDKVEFLYTDEVSEDLALDDASDFEDDESIDSFSVYDDEILNEDWTDNEFADGDSDALKF
ncbi:MAG: hypothetical protein IJR40_07170 [Treponema sp.]|nr:hypothetical protein [Treponema sp.]MBQ7618857.1 hypothetical protein [Treponema sp.]MBQ9626941.1 hypothetical protein [Treponema sp.]